MVAIKNIHPSALVSDIFLHPLNNWRLALRGADTLMFHTITFPSVSSWHIPLALTKQHGFFLEVILAGTLLGFPLSSEAKVISCLFCHLGVAFPTQSHFAMPLISPVMFQQHGF